MNRFISCRLLALSTAFYLCVSVCVAEEEAFPKLLRDAQVNLPQGYRVAAYLNCGEAELSAGSAEGPRIVQRKGLARMGKQAGPKALASAATDPEQVAFEVLGLDRDKEYVFGFTWYDSENAGRVQSVRFGSGEADSCETVLPPTPALAFLADQPTWARVLLPLAGKWRGRSSIQVAFAKESGPDVVVSDVWLLEGTPDAGIKRVLIVSGDDYAGHLWRDTAPEFAAMLREDPRLEVSISEAPVMVASPLLAHYDAVLLHFKNYNERLSMPAAYGEALRGYVASGGGLVIAHFGCGAFQEWASFVDVAGRVWNPEKRGHDAYRAFEVEIVDSDHPVTEGMVAFETEDELYTCLDGTTEIRVLCSAVSNVDQQRYPMGFVHALGRGRVFHCPLGHDLPSLKHAGTRALYLRAVVWASG